MYCHSCGKTLPAESAFCNVCGKATSLPQETQKTGFRQEHLTRPINETDASSDAQSLFRIRPTFLNVAMAYVVASVLSLLAAAIVGYFELPFQSAIIAAIIFFLPAFYKHIERNRIVYTLGPGKIEIDSGLIARTTRNIPLRNVQDVTTSATILQRMLGLGDVIIDSASDAGKITMRNIRDPRKYADMILAQLQRWN
jgi:membrane protein YdbS with pleckstrin-like domain